MYGAGNRYVLRPSQLCTLLMGRNNFHFPSAQLLARINSEPRRECIPFHVYLSQRQHPKAVTEAYSFEYLKERREIQPSPSNPLSWVSNSRYPSRRGLIRLLIGHVQLCMYHLHFGFFLICISVFNSSACTPCPSNSMSTNLSPFSGFHPHRDVRHGPLLQVNKRQFLLPTLRHRVAVQTQQINSFLSPSTTCTSSHFSFHYAFFCES